MTFEEMLDETGIQYAEAEFLGEVSPPYIAYLLDAETIAADSTVVYVTCEITLELYRSKKDTISESAVEEVLKKYGIAYDKKKIWIGESQRVYEVVYTFDWEGDL